MRWSKVKIHVVSPKKIKQKIGKNVVHNTEHLGMLANEESAGRRSLLHFVVWNNLGWMFATGA